MGQMVAIKKVNLGVHHRDTGRTKHTLADSHGVRPFSAFTSLVITRWSEPYDGGFYLMHVCADGTGTDNWHETLEDAMHQADFEFGV